LSCQPCHTRGFSLLFLACFLHDTSSPFPCHGHVPLEKLPSHQLVVALTLPSLGPALALPTHVVCNCSHALTFSPHQSVLQCPAYYKAESLPALMTPFLSITHGRCLTAPSLDFLSCPGFCFHLLNIFPLRLPCLCLEASTSSAQLPLHRSSRAYRHTKAPPPPSSTALKTLNPPSCAT
jgi:hypothetical protein